MPDTKPQSSEFKFTSRTFPTAEDMKLWDSLTPSERFQVIERDEQAGFESGVAPQETLRDRLQRVRRT